MFLFLFALVQAQPPVIPDPSDLIAQLMAAWNTQHWLVFTSLIVGAVVAFSKQGWFGTVLAKIPSTWRPYFGIGIGVLTTVSTDLYQGKALAATLVDCLGGILAACMAVMGHQTVVEHMRAGKELVPKAPWANGAPPAANGNGNAPKPKDTLEFPKKPAAMGRWATAFALAAFVAFTPVITGCADILNNPVYVAQQLAQYVTLFIQTAQTVWQAIVPLLGANAQADTAAFNDSIVVLQNADAVMIDVAQAVAAGKVGDLAHAIQAVQDAVAHVMAVITQFQSSAQSVAPASAALTSDKMAELSRMATSIQHWGESK